ncbi:MAG: hypothetical protein P8X53_14005, partial [Chromatiales bacterium]
IASSQIPTTVIRRTSFSGCSSIMMIALPLMFTQTRIQRWEGALLVAIYCGYMGWLFSRV